VPAGLTCFARGKDIERMLRGRPSIHSVRDIQTQWVGPSAFMIKAECDFDGGFFSSLLEDVYSPILRYDMDTANIDDLWLTLHDFSEDVTRLIEIEIHEAEDQIRKKYPQAAFIHLEPDSKDSYLTALAGREQRVFPDDAKRQAWAESRSRTLVDKPTALRRRARRLIEANEYTPDHPAILKIMQLADKLEKKRLERTMSVASGR
jgi:zinc transporter 9